MRIDRYGVDDSSHTVMWAFGDQIVPEEVNYRRAQGHRDDAPNVDVKPLTPARRTRSLRICFSFCGTHSPHDVTGGHGSIISTVPRAAYDMLEFSTTYVPGTVW